jgi:hypothetical protein
MIASSLAHLLTCLSCSSSVLRQDRYILIYRAAWRGSLASFGYDPIAHPQR